MTPGCYKISTHISTHMRPISYNSVFSYNSLSSLSCASWPPFQLFLHFFQRFMFYFWNALWCRDCCVTFWNTMWWFMLWLPILVPFLLTGIRTPSDKLTSCCFGPGCMRGTIWFAPESHWSHQEGNQTLQHWVLYYNHKQTVQNCITLVRITDCEPLVSCNMRTGCWSFGSPATDTSPSKMKGLKQGWRLSSLLWPSGSACWFN